MAAQFPDSYQSHYRLEDGKTALDYPGVQLSHIVHTSDLEFGDDVTGSNEFAIAIRRISDQSSGKNRS